MYDNDYLGKNNTVKLMKIIPFATNIFFFSCMMLLVIAKFYRIIGRKKMKSIWEPLARHCSFIP